MEGGRGGSPLAEFGLSLYFVIYYGGEMFLTQTLKGHVHVGEHVRFSGYFSRIL